MLGLLCFEGFSLAMASGGDPLVAVHRLLVVVASLVAVGHRPWHTWASVVAPPRI